MIICFLIYGWKDPSEKAKRNARLTLAVILVVAESSWHIWNLYWGHWSIQTMLPLHMCSIMIIISIIMLLTRNYTLYEFVYFLGIGGAMQAVLTPEAGIYGFPHFRMFQTLIVHSTLMLSGIYMTAVEGYRPTWASFKRVFIFTNLYAVVVYGINLLLGSNYLYVMHKPPTASLLDVLGPWPWYLVALEGIAFMLFFLLYLPFAIKDWRETKAGMAPAG
jgi:hypothetical integral membrane protein (TIGR02206 family)